MSKYHPDDYVVWADGTVATVEELDQFGFMSDDYAIVGQEDHRKMAEMNTEAGHDLFGRGYTLAEICEQAGVPEPIAV